MAINDSSVNSAAINASGALTAFTFAKKIISGRSYRCTLTGSANALDDIVIPISSINGRLNAGGVSSLNIVCPNGVDYAADIVNRDLGTFIIATTEHYTDGTSDTTDSPEFANLAITYQRGGRSYSVSLRGEVNITLHYPPRKIAIQGFSYEAMQANGTRRIRCAMDKDFLPGDTAVLPDGEEVVMNAATYVIGPKNSSMELSEN